MFAVDANDCYRIGSATLRPQFFGPVFQHSKRDGFLAANRREIFDETKENFKKFLRMAQERTMSSIQVLDHPFHPSLFHQHFLRDGRNRGVFQSTDVGAATVVSGVSPSGRLTRRS